MMTLRGGRGVGARHPERRVDRSANMPHCRPSGAVQAVPVQFETGDENADEALMELSLVGDRGRRALPVGPRWH